MDGIEKLDVLISAKDLKRRIGELGAEITRDYAGREPVIVCVLKGALFFMADLCREIDLPITIDTLGMSSYGDQTSSSGVVRITQDLSKPIVDRDVIIVEDIIDTGLTLAFLLDNLRARKPRSIEICSLLHKPARTRIPVQAKYIGFTIEDRFVVGYGLDWEQKMRNVPFVGVVRDA
ncbi:MAG TPA: hypoxanthine phosphoribosyltransferase [Myxococcota bacterium]|nr:hypoxanthine phosphoribosyltransferase [Myxococcota bacterium]